MSIIKIFKTNNNKKEKVFFDGTDSKEEFEKNLTIMPEDWIYREKEIIYKINSDGYRTTEFKKINWKKSIVVLGCSCVYGTGLAEDETISSSLSRLTGMNVVNMGVSGGSNDLIINNCAKIINDYDFPFAIVACWTSPLRFIFHSKKEIVNIGNWTNKNEKKLSTLEYQYCDFLYKYRQKNLNNLIFTYKNIKNHMKAILKDRSKFIDLSVFSDAEQCFDCEIFDFADYARDLKHPGRETAKNMANHVYEKLNK
jgi:hypothetical protein